MTPSIWPSLVQALERLRCDDVVALPTETVYGLAGCVDSEEAIKKIFHIKARPFFDPLIVHVSDLSMAKVYVENISSVEERLIQHFWPGPLTLVMKKTDRVSSLITSGREDVALRSPAHPYFRRILRGLKRGLAAPSANRFGKTSPSEASHVVEEFGEQVFVVDGGPCRIGIESTVVRVSATRIEILRPGSITAEQIQSVCPGAQIHFQTDGASPGHLENHYQPSKDLILLNHAPDEFFRSERVELKLPFDEILAARVLYSELRRLSQLDAREIYFVIQKEHFSPQWRAIRDRLLKASSNSKEVSWPL